MDRFNFHIVDVFAERKYCGNQLAVVTASDGAPLGEELTTDEMQNIAREMNYSETTYVISEGGTDNSYDVRIFTPNAEIPFAGHPTLGTAYIIQQEIGRKQMDEVLLNLKVGSIPVAFTYGETGDPVELWMTQNKPVFAETLDPAAVAKALSLNKSDIDTRFPVQAVSTGLPFIIIPLQDLDAVKRCRISMEPYLSLVSKRDAQAIMVFSPETYSAKNQINARMFAPLFGVSEDPATGSASGCLAGYLVEHSYFGSDSIECSIEQGYEIHRPSLILIQAKREGESITVRVGGRVIKVARGIFY